MTLARRRARVFAATLFPVLLLVVPALAPGAAGQGAERPIAEGRFQLPEFPGEDVGFAPRNATFDIVVRFRAREPIDDVLEVRVDRGTVNRTRIPVDVAGGDVFSAGLRVHRIRPADDGHAELVAAFRNTTDEGRPLEIVTRVTVVPQPRTRLLSPPNLGNGERGDPDDGRRRVGKLKAKAADWNEEVPVRARFENPWNVPTGPLPVQVLSGDHVVDRTTVASLEAGEVRNATLATVTRGDLEGPGRVIASHGDGPPVRVGRVLLALGGPGSDRGGRDTLLDYTFPGRDIRTQLAAHGQIAFLRGIQIARAQANLTLGEASSVTVEVRHHGGSPAASASLDMRLHPVPNLAYGVDSSARRSVTARLEPGQSRFVNVSITPRVALPHVLVAEVDAGGRTTEDRTQVPLEGPVDIRVTDGALRTLDRGESAEAALEVQAREPMAGDLGWTATTLEAARRPGQGPPFSTLLTREDLLGASFTPQRVSLSPDDGATVNGTATLRVTPETAGRVAVVPFLKVDGIVHPGIEDADAIGTVLGGVREPVGEERPGGAQRATADGVLGLKVLPTGRLGPAIVVAPALVLLGVAGVEVHRRWFVR